MAALLKRLGRVFYAPAQVMEELRENPRWLGALVAGAALVLLANAFIPTELMRETMRLQALASGAELPENIDRMAEAMRRVSLGVTPVFWLVWNFFMAGVVTVIFAFLFGDEGTYRQYLAVVTHATFIGGMGALLTTPLRLQAQDLYLALSLGTFASGFMPEGYWLNVLKSLDLFGLWGYGVIAVGAAAIEKRRTWLSAFIAVSIFGVVVAMAVAPFRN